MVVAEDVLVATDNVVVANDTRVVIVSDDVVVVGSDVLAVVANDGVAVNGSDIAVVVAGKYLRLVAMVSDDVVVECVDLVVFASEG